MNIPKKKKKSRFPNLSRKREKISNVFGLGALGPWVIFKKKKKILWTRGIELPSDFFLKAQFFSFKDFKIKKIIIINN